MKLPIYLDYMATTPVDPRVTQQMQACLGLEGKFGNPASQTHRYGYDAQEAVESARAKIAELIHCDPREIIFTSGATESDNLAIKGAAQFYARQGKHIVTMATEHKAVLDTCHYLESQGFEISYLKPEKDGLLDLEKFKNALRSDTVLVSIMYVNNETGVIQDIKNLSAITRERGILFHCDAAQAAGKIAINIKELNVDLMSLSAHKLYGPKGIGALYIRRSPPLHLQPLLHGGGHEQGLRSGTLPTHQIVGFGEAAELAKKNLLESSRELKELGAHLLENLQKIPGMHLNGNPEHKIPQCLNIYFDGVDGESLLLSLRDLAISTGSACNSANPEASHVLLAMGLDRLKAYNSLRVSLGKFTTREEVDYAIKCITEKVEQLRNISPLW